MIQPRKLKSINGKGYLNLQIAVLSLISINSEKALDALISQAKSTITDMRPPGLLETAIYLSENSLPAYYVLSFFDRSDHLQAYLTLFQSQSEVGRLEEQHIFRMLREYRRLPSRPGASHIRLLTFREDISEADLAEYLGDRRAMRRSSPDMIATWTGQDISDRNTILHRVDWTTTEAMRAFFDREDIGQMLGQHQARCKRFEFASFQLQSILELESRP